jgi:hypothetical protein
VGTPPWLLIGAAVGGSIIVIIIGILLTHLQRDEGDQVPTLDPTTLAEYALPAADPILVDSGTPWPQVNTPASIVLKGLEYLVLPYQVQADGEWHYPAGQSGTAVWVYGTIINFVIGIEQTEANIAVLESLAPGDGITMTTASGGVYQFGFAGREELASSATDLFAQTHPGLTLVSLGGKDNARLVAHFRYLKGGEQAGTAAEGGLTVSVGEVAQLGDIRLTVLGTAYVYDDPSVPEGWAFYVVDYQIENLSQEVLDPGRFRMQLQDGAGNTYSLNLPASQAGTFGYLLLTIPPNMVAQGTAGYLVPAPLHGPRLSWSFAQLGAPESMVRVLIEFDGPQEIVDPDQLAAVDLSRAELSGDRTLLSVWGTVLNNSEDQLVVAGEEITLTGAGKAMPLRAADPAPPWTIAPGDVLSFRVAFQRPASPVATFTVLNRPFEISGLD